MAAQRYYYSTRDLLMMAALAALGGLASTYINFIGDFFQSLFGFAGTNQWAAGLHVLWLILAVGLTKKLGAGTITDDDDAPALSIDNVTVTEGTGGTPQQGCTNSPPVKLVNGLSGQLDGQRFDVVFDYGNDGYYDIGVDFLDVISTRSDGTLVTAKELESLSDDQIFGLEIQ